MHTTTDVTEEAKINRLQQINTTMLTDTLHVLSQQLTSSDEGIAANAAASIVHVIDAFPADLSQVDERLAKDHAISLTDVLALALSRQILARAPAVPPEGV